jgi:branched-chain amino acid transport system substrate-binding protein
MACAIAAVALAAGALAACSGGTATDATSPAGSSATGPITIGASLSLTGDFAADGVAFEQGYQLWAADVNAKGGIMGRQVELTILDDRSDPNQVVTNYQTLINIDHVDLTFGPFSSLLTTPASGAAARNGYAFIEGAGGAPTVFQSAANTADHNVFDVSLPIADEFLPFVNYIKSLGSAADKKLTAAFPSADDPFAAPAVKLAEQQLAVLGVQVVYDRVFSGKALSYRPAADQVAAIHPDIVVLGSADVPTVAAFMQEFAQRQYTPKLFIAAAGPDQGAAFTSVVKPGNAAGMMVPDGWYPGYANAASKQMVAEYATKYKVSASGVNADVAEAYSVGQVAASAVTATKGTNNQNIILYLHSGVSIPTVQGTVKFDSIGENSNAVAFVFQWQHGGTKFVQVLPQGAGGSVPILASKPPWG